MELENVNSTSKVPNSNQVWEMKLYKSRYVLQKKQFRDVNIGDGLYRL
jgi:hypothetical protein